MEFWISGVLEMWRSGVLKFWIGKLQRWIGVP